MKTPVRVGRSVHGLTFCGIRILPGRLLMSRRRRRRYGELRRRAERDAMAMAGRLDGPGLQAAYSSALALTLQTDAAAWRRAQLRPRLGT